MDEVPKRIKWAIRELARAAYEIELGRALAKLRGQFARWERDEVTAFDLEKAIHKFHEGPARELFMRYTSGMLDLAVAHAIVTGLLDRAKIDPEVLAPLGRAFSFYESQDLFHEAGPDQAPRTRRLRAHAGAPLIRKR
jgi:hypothetical protein